MVLLNIDLEAGKVPDITNYIDGYKQGFRHQQTFERLLSVLFVFFLLVMYARYFRLH